MNLGYDLFYDTSTILLMPVIGSHFLLGINPFLLPILVLLQSNATRVASKQFYLYACRFNCHRWNLMGIFSSNKVEVSTYWFEYTLTTFMGVKHFYRASNVAYKQQQQFWSISPKTIPARGWACHQWWKALCNNNLHVLSIIITQDGHYVVIKHRNDSLLKLCCFRATRGPKERTLGSKKSPTNPP